MADFLPLISTSCRMLADTAPPRDSSNKLDSPLGLIAAVARIYSLYGSTRRGSILYVGQTEDGLSKKRSFIVIAAHLRHIP